jgi:hypothetical protein
VALVKARNMTRRFAMTKDMNSQREVPHTHSVKQIYVAKNKEIQDTPKKNIENQSHKGAS